MPPADFWDTEDEWYQDRTVMGARHVRPPRKARDDNYGRRSELLPPDHHTSVSSGLYRTRSQGHQPAPHINIYNTTRNDNESNPHVRTDQISREPSPRTSPRGRPLKLQDEWALEDQLAEIRMELARTRRDRSRSVHHHREDSPERSPRRSPAYDRWQLDAANERLKENEERLLLEKREEAIKKKLELKYLKEKLEREEEEAHVKAEQDRIRKEMELKYEKEKRERMERELAAEEERKRIIAENTAKLEKAEREAKAQRQAAIDAYQRKQAEEEREAKEERDRIIREWKFKQSEDEAKAKKQREELIMHLKMEEEKQKAKEKEEYERFLAKQKAKEEEEKEKKKKQEAELEEAMRKRLAQFGFQENQIQAMVKPEDAARQQQLQPGMAPGNPLRITHQHHHHQPTYVKVHKDHLAIDTLLYYDIPYEVDRSDPDYLIILREMDTRETEILFEHTRRLRSRSSTRLLIEERRDRNDKPEYAWVRRKQSRSPSRRRSSPKRVVGIKEMFY